MKTTLFLVVVLAFLVIGTEACSDKFKTNKCKKLKNKGKCDRDVAKENCQKTCDNCPVVLAAAPV